MMPPSAAPTAPPAAAKGARTNYWAHLHKLGFDPTYLQQVYGRAYAAGASYLEAGTASAEDRQLVAMHTAALELCAALHLRTLQLAQPQRVAEIQQDWIAGAQQDFVEALAQYSWKMLSAYNPRPTFERRPQPTSSSASTMEQVQAEVLQPGAGPSSSSTNTAAATSAPARPAQPPPPPQQQQQQQQQPAAQQHESRAKGKQRGRRAGAKVQARRAQHAAQHMAAQPPVAAQRGSQQPAPASSKHALTVCAATIERIAQGAFNTVAALIARTARTTPHRRHLRRKARAVPRGAASVPSSAPAQPQPSTPQPQPAAGSAGVGPVTDVQQVEGRDKRARSHSRRHSIDMADDPVSRAAWRVRPPE
jgi:hypothetical protein